MNAPDSPQSRVSAGFVREARAASDAPALAHVQVASWRATLGGLVPDEVLSELSGEAVVEQFGDQWREAITSPPTSRHKVLVAYAPGVIAEVPVGFASIGPATDEDRWPGTDGELYELHVLPADSQVRRGQAGGDSPAVRRGLAGGDSQVWRGLAGGDSTAGHAGRLLHAVADTLAEDGFNTACAWALAADSARVGFLKAAGWAPDGCQGNLDMGVKVPVIRLHTLLAGGTA